jgi:hypothetical protein
VFPGPRTVRRAVEDRKGRGARKKPLNFAVWRIMAVRRLEGRRGRPLDVLVEWEGEESRVNLTESETTAQLGRIVVGQRHIRLEGST